MTPSPESSHHHISRFVEELESPAVGEKLICCDVSRASKRSRHVVPAVSVLPSAPPPETSQGLCAGICVCTNVGDLTLLPWSHPISGGNYNISQYFFGLETSIFFLARLQVRGGEGCSSWRRASSAGLGPLSRRASVGGSGG